MPHFLYKLFACLIFIYTFATATKEEEGKKTRKQIISRQLVN